MQRQSDFELSLLCNQKSYLAMTVFLSLEHIGQLCRVQPARKRFGGAAIWPGIVTVFFEPRTAVDLSLHILQQILHFGMLASLGHASDKALLCYSKLLPNVAHPAR